MRHRVWTSILTAMFLLSGAVFAQEPGKADRLFRSHDLLDVTIAAPLKRLMDERPNDVDFPGTLSYVDEDGATIEFDIGLRTRGRYRRQERICPFAPIRLNFGDSKTKGTLFRKQDKLKLVTHCRNSSKRYQQVAFKEYLMYRLFNELTDLSFRVRLLRITYVDSADPDDAFVRHGFVIEHRKRLSKRLDLPSIEVPRTQVAALNGAYTNLMSVFQYYIANTDFSPIAGAPDDNCCHNIELFGNPGEPIYSVPYDYDMAGMTDAPYATPNPKFEIRNVRQRLYRGRCVNNQHLNATFQLFREHRELFASMVEDMELLTDYMKKGIIALMERFDKLIDNPKAVDKKIAGACI